MTLGRRILVEKRATIVPLVAAILVNVAVYAFVVYPLGVKSAGAATRAERAASTLKAAETDLAAARGLVAGTTRADEESKSSGLGRMVSHVLLQGEYENFRNFIYDLESAPEFVIIDDIALSQAEPGKPLTLTVQLSTYYRLGANGN
ncbi:MAG: hypothetical protein AUI11_00165 [Acidobacteria bacterium 13_2_20CM_2_66_4]|nr:MAG: hypothetical protein AUI11_00165 [Acidobacteria bacterium 13_2_20CM_2_66_4]